MTCPDTAWRSRPYATRSAAEEEARAIDQHLLAVTGALRHRHDVVELPDRMWLRAHAGAHRDAPDAA